MKNNLSIYEIGTYPYLLRYLICNFPCWPDFFSPVNILSILFVHIYHLGYEGLHLFHLFLTLIFLVLTSFFEPVLK